MANPVYYETSVLYAAAQTCWTHLPTIFDAGNDLAASIRKPPMPKAPTQFDGPAFGGSTSGVFALDSAYFARTQLTTETFHQIPFVLVDVRPSFDLEFFDREETLIAVPVDAWYGVSVDAATDDPRTAKQMVRQLARTGAHALRHVLLKYLPTVARTMDATDAFGIVVARPGGSITADEPYPVVVSGRDVLVSLGHVRTEVLQVIDTPHTTP